MRTGARFAALVLWAASTAAALGSQDGLPVVIEDVDEITVLHCTAEIGQGNYLTPRVIFWRDGKILDTRVLVDEMQFTTQGGKFQLIWQDYWQTYRIVEAPRYSVVVLSEDPTQEGQQGEWWAMARRMTQLRQP